jgi:hypothetical protein
MKDFTTRLIELDKKARKFVLDFMNGRKSFTVMSKKKIDSDDSSWQDETCGIPFSDKHGFVDYAHVTRIFKDKDYGSGELWIAGISYSAGQELRMPLSWLEAGSICLVADLIPH